MESEALQALGGAVAFILLGFATFWSNRSKKNAESVSRDQVGIKDILVMQQQSLVRIENKMDSHIRDHTLVPLCPVGQNGDHSHEDCTKKWK